MDAENLDILFRGILHGLLIVSLILALALIALSFLMLERKLVDLELQRADSSNGRRHRVVWTNVRAYANRIFLGAVFTFVNVLLIADAPIEWRQWGNRILWALLLASYVRATVLDRQAERANLQETIERRRVTQVETVAAGVQQAEDRAEAKAVGVAEAAQLSAAEGVRRAEDRADHRSDEVARVAVLTAQAGETTPVDVATIAPEAAQVLAEAVRQNDEDRQP